MIEECIAENESGIRYEEFSCLYPTLGKTYLDFERYYNITPVLKWMQARAYVPVLAVVGYCVFIVVGQAAMKDREPWKWRRVLAVWNLSLSLFSFVGAVRTAPQLFHNIMNLSVRDNLCMDPEVSFGSGSTGLWVQLFILSKFPELGDTFFIVVHKKKLLFLHYYHHVTVLLYCWHSYVSTSPSGLFFVVMNYCVHAIMYMYYFLMAIKMKPQWLNAMFITCAQISQMVVGVVVTLLGFHFYSTDTNNNCFIQKENNIAAFIMYGSYLFLFAQFFVGRYFKVQASAKSTKTKKVL